MKKILLSALFALLPAISSAGQYAYGDSITYGVNASSGYSYLYLLSSALGESFTNYAVSGNQAADTAIISHNANYGASDLVTLMIGTNDQWKYGTDTGKQALFSQFFTEIIADICFPAKVHGRDAGMTYTGTWSNTQPSWSQGKTTTVAGNTATATVSGTAVYVGVIKQDNLNGNPISGTAEVYIDGVDEGQIGTQATGMTTQNGNSYAPAAYRFGGLSSGSHTVEVKVTSAYSDYRGTFYLEYIAGSQQAATPNLYLSNIPHYTAAGYASVGGSDANLAAYNAMENTVMTNAIADGANIHFVDAQSRVNQTFDVSADGVHPTNSGHLHIEGAFYDVMMGYTAQ